ncbi:hypothetical protein ACTZQ7_15160, partial [Klebsiella pneumoniae]
TVCVVGKMRDLILQLSKSSIYSTKPTTGQKYHQNHNKRLYSRFQPAIRYFVTSSIAFFYR